MLRFLPSRCGRVFGLAAIFGLGSIALSHAQELAPPSDPVAKAAFDVLDKHCARCHQVGRLDPTKTKDERPRKDFGFVLQLDKLAADPHYIVPGNPNESRLFKNLSKDGEMPYDVRMEGASLPDLSPAEANAVAAWIQSLGVKTAAACATRQFVGHEDVIDLIAGDLRRLSSARRKTTRYLTLTHMKNACIDDAALNVYRMGAIKLINSLSRSSEVVRLEAVDPDQTILRINLDDLGWEAKDWDTVLAQYPYNTQPDKESIVILERSTGTKFPYARADWFAFKASRPGLYEKLLKLPTTFQALAKDQGVDVEGDIKRFAVARAGFQKSGVSRNNRLIERHASRSGYFWTSYDFAGNKTKQSLFEFPLGPGGDNGFNHDGGETIFSLPNGFQAYYLSTAKGDALSNGPTNIVQDPTSKDLTVTNGISCMGCHDQGMRKAKDEVRSIVVQGRTFPKETREAVEALYPPTDKMDTVIAGDASRFADAMKRAGLDPTLKLNGVEMVTALSKRYENDLDLTLAAAELGMSKAEFAEASREADRKFRTLVRRLEQGSIPRDQFETNFAAFADNISDEEIVNFGGGAAQKPGAKVGRGSSDIAVTSDKDVYKQNATAIFTVVSSRDCFLTLTDVDEKGEGTVLFPNKFAQDNRIKANAEVQLPPSGAPFQYRLKDKGTETVTAVCSEKKGEVDGIKQDFTRSAFTSVSNYSATVARTRSIAVEATATGQPAASGQPAAPGKPAAPPAAAKSPEAARELFRTAIKVQVE